MKNLQKVFNAQNKNPLEGDWLKLVETDFEKLGLEINKNLIKKLY